MVLARRHKLKDRRAFRQIRQLKVAYTCPFFKVFAKENKHLSLSSQNSRAQPHHPLIGITFLKGQVKGAIQRNKIKRRIEDAFREVYSLAPECYIFFQYLIFRVEGAALQAKYADFVSVIAQWQAKLNYSRSRSNSSQKAE
ncbi:MAG: ribonuclease P protein component [Candidatus Caenarcaniphilales bacterium]|nr:ribonuclease P protein component [Candidatus Caenarcaniphilales bacterium]